MKLARFSTGVSTIVWGSLDADGVTVHVIDEPFDSWALKMSSGAAASVKYASKTLRLQDLQLKAPCEMSWRMFNIGSSYLAHLRGLTSLFPKIPPDVPVTCVVPIESQIGPGETIRNPSYTDMLDYEVELVAVVGRPLVAGERPSASLLGYTIGNDISVRDTQEPFGTPNLYEIKVSDFTKPLGPWIVTADELGGPGHPSLELSLTLNGELRQRDNTGKMCFSIDYMLSYLNLRNLLRPGDLLSTGTTSGPMGEHKGEPGAVFLQEGDVLEARIEKIGELRNVVGPKEPARGPLWPKEPNKSL